MFSRPDKNIKELDLQPGMKVADLGSGPGFYSFAAAEYVAPKGVVYAVDIQKGLLEKIASEAEERGYSGVIEVIRGDVEKEEGSKLADSSVDAVILANTLFQLDDPQAVITEAARITKDGGKILMIDWTDSFGGLGPQPDHILEFDRVVEMFTGAGGEVERTIDAGDHHYGAVFLVHKSDK